tara:strand:+ start:1696 stop:2211 length:516 start_codon:yes stop_codon:yes gene_type:complete
MKHRPWRKSVFQGTSLLAAVVLLLFVFVSAGYFYFLQGDNPDDAPPDAALLAAQAQWDETRPAAFRYELLYGTSVDGDASLAYTVTEEGARHSAVARPLAESSSAVGTVPDEQVMTIDRLLATIENADAHTARIDASYDPRFGFPAQVEFHLSDGRWQRYVIRDFEVLEYQ